MKKKKKLKVYYIEYDLDFYNIIFGMVFDI